MSEINNGGHAFPTVEEFEVRLNDVGFTVVDTRTVHRNGMSLRDYFAAKAMQSLIAHHGNGDTDACAVYAFGYADAMLKAREK